MTGRPPNTALRFLAVGGSVALLYAILAAIATSLLPLPRAVSSGALWVLCIPVAFGLQRRFTFTARKPHRHGLWLYAATQGLGIGIAASVSYLLATGSFRHDVFVHLLASALVAVVSYLISRWIVFPQPTAE
jgi:putative flippase GtrA